MNSERAQGSGPRAQGFSQYVFAFSLLPFIVLATANSAGYRFGASDQAFYAPAILERMDPARYPRDSALIQAQAKLTFVDDVVGPIASLVHLPLPSLFVALQVITLTVLAFAATRVAQACYRTRWAAVALMAAFTLRHAIVKSGTNTLEGYFHPRQFSFALGALAVTEFLHGRAAATLVLVAIAGALHPTTGLWFAIWLSIAAFVADRRLRAPVIGVASACALLATWAFTAGPLAGRTWMMDEEWLATLASKDYLFPWDWPLTAWLVNLGYVPLIIFIYRRRLSAGVLAAREGALVTGVLTLVLVWAMTLPLNAAHVALAIQLQPARIFWLLDFMAVIYVVWLAAEGPLDLARGKDMPRDARARLVALAIALVSIARGVYIMRVEFPDRRIAQVDLSDGDWGRAMRWARSTPLTTGWLADPGHAARYGTSIRVAAERDVFVEGIKDGAVGMYERAVAIRTRDRLKELGDFVSLTPDRARHLAAEYDLDYLVTEQTLDLPIAFRSGRITIYRLKT
jgi:hypothetical protein